jgi:hypothetical protein
MGKLRSQREVLVLGQVRARNHGNQVKVLVDNGELALLGLGQDFVRLGQGNAIGSSDEVVDHDLGDRCAVVIFELDVSVGDNTKELGTDRAVLCISELVTKSPICFNCITVGRRHVQVIV